MYDILWDFRVKLKATTHSNTKKVLFCRLIPPTSSLTPQERVRIWVLVVAHPTPTIEEKHQYQFVTIHL